MTEKHDVDAVQRTLAVRITIPATEGEPDRPTHDGYKWIYVLDGRLQLA